MKVVSALLYLCIASVACGQNSSTASTKNSSTASTKNLTSVSTDGCSSDKDCQKGFSCYSDKCLVTWTDSLNNLALSMTNDYTTDFETSVKDIIGANIYELGSPLMDDTQIEGIIPGEDAKRRESVDAYVKEKFGDVVKPGFKAIVTKGVSQWFTDFCINAIKKNLSETEIQGDLKTKTETVVKLVRSDLDKYVQISWEKFKLEQKGAVDQIAAENPITPAQPLKRRFFPLLILPFIMGPAIAATATGVAVAATVTGILRVGEWVIQVLENVVDVLKGAWHMVVNIQDGIKEFVESLAHGDVGGAFAALGKGFVNAFVTAINTIASSVKKAWGVVIMIGQDLVKLAKTYLFFIPPKWLAILISIGISIAIGVVFTPMVLGALGFELSVMTGIIVGMAIEIIIFDPIQEVTIDKFVKKELGVPDEEKTGMEDGIMDAKKTGERPAEISENGQKYTLDKERDEYCRTESEDYYCINETLKQECIIRDDQPPTCQDEKGWYVDQDGTKSYFDPSSGSWNPPLKKSASTSTGDTITFEGTTLTKDKKSGKYCYDTADKKHICLDDSKKELCYTSKKLYYCKGKNGWYMESDGKIYILNDKKEWVLQSKA